MESVGQIDVLIVVLYFAGLLTIGLMAGRKVGSSKDFALAGGELKFPLLLGTLIATAVGAAATMGRAGKAYEVGVLIALSGLAYGLGLLAFSYFAPIIKRINYWSVPDALGARYGRAFRLVAAIIILAGLTGLFASQLMALGITASFMGAGIGLTFTMAVVISAFVMTAYTLFGGMKSVAAADMLQVIIILSVIGICLPVILMIEMGGPVPTLKAIPPTDGNWLGGMTVVYLVSLFLIDIPIVLIDASLWQKTGAAKNVKHIRRAALIAGLVFIFWGTLTSSYGVIAQRLEPGLVEAGYSADSALPALILNYMPTVLKGLAFAALIAVMISTAATAMLVAGTTVGFEIVKTLKPQATDQTILMVTRLTIAIVAVFGVMIALNAEGVFDLLLLSMAIYVAGLFVPTMCALFWTRATSIAAMMSSLGGAVCVIALYGMKGAGTLPTFIEPIVGGLLVSGIVMVLVSWVTYRNGNLTPRLVDTQHPVAE